MTADIAWCGQQRWLAWQLRMLQVVLEHGGGSPAARSRPAAGGGTPVRHASPHFFASAQLGTLGSAGINIAPTQLLQPTQVLGCPSPTPVAAPEAAAEPTAAHEGAPEAAMPFVTRLRFDAGSNEEQQGGSAGAGASVPLLLATEALPQLQGHAGGSNHTPAVPMAADAAASIPAPQPASKAAQQSGGLNSMAQQQLQQVAAGNDMPAPRLPQLPVDCTPGSGAGQLMGHSSSEALMVLPTEPAQVSELPAPQTANEAYAPGSDAAGTAAMAVPQPPQQPSSVDQRQPVTAAVRMSTAAVTAPASGGHASGGPVPGPRPLVSTAPNSLEWPGYFVREVNHLTPPAVHLATEAVHELQAAEVQLQPSLQPQSAAAGGPSPARGVDVINAASGNGAQAMETDIGADAMPMDTDEAAPPAQHPPEGIAAGLQAVPALGAPTDAAGSSAAGLPGSSTAGQQQRLQLVLHPSKEMPPPAVVPCAEKARVAGSGSPQLLAPAAPAAACEGQQGEQHASQPQPQPATTNGALSFPGAAADEQQNGLSPAPTSRSPSPSALQPSPTAVPQAAAPQPAAALAPPASSPLPAPESTQQKTPRRVRGGSLTPQPSQRLQGSAQRPRPLGSSEEGQVVCSVNPEVRAELDTYNHGA